MHAFSALADPTRRQIIEMLAGGERTAGDIVRQFDVSAPAISQHLKVLKEARLVTVRADAQRRIYALDAAGIDEVDAWLSGIRHFWRGRLDALERELKVGERELKAARKDEGEKS
jgi:DNA-binding transcriptional ArsR family regulator